MIYKKKSLAVLVLKLPNGNFRTTDIFGKIEEYTPADFSKYVDAIVSTSAEIKDSAIKESLQTIHALLLSENTAEAIQMIETFL
jgi:hypothetical protein